MSAENITLCPRCSEKVEKESKKQYSRSEQTLEENFSIGIDAFTKYFYIRYEASCTDCGFHYVYRLDEPIGETNE